MLSITVSPDDPDVLLWCSTLDAEDRLTMLLAMSYRFWRCRSSRVWHQHRPPRGVERAARGYLPARVPRSASARRRATGGMRVSRTYTPGIPWAIAKGCICDPELNERGAGRVEDDGFVFEADFQCPLHGYHAALGQHADEPERRTLPNPCSRPAPVSPGALGRESCRKRT